MKGLVIPVELDRPIREFDLAQLADEHGTRLKALQHLVGGWIQAVPLAGYDDTTTYVNEEGKFEAEMNARATLLMTRVVPTLLPGDFISGPLVLIGFDPARGDDLDGILLGEVAGSAHLHLTMPARLSAPCAARQRGP